MFPRCQEKSPLGLCVTTTLMETKAAHRRQIISCESSENFLDNYFWEHLSTDASINMHSTMVNQLAFTSGIFYDKQKMFLQISNLIRLSWQRYYTRSLPTIFHDEWWYWRKYLTTWGRNKFKNSLLDESCISPLVPDVH